MDRGQVLDLGTLCRIKDWTRRVFETLDFIGYIRTFVLAPLLQLKNHQQPRGLRRVEFTFSDQDIDLLKSTVAEYSPQKIISAMNNTVTVYLSCRKALFPSTIKLHHRTEKRAMEYYHKVISKVATK